ncbi:hypothetical protein C7212DRAFT_81327, partial [Tuber magnatum]
PFIQIVLNATNSRTAALIITILVISTNIQNIMNCAQISSRVIWSFARDEGFIFSKYFRDVHPALKAPVRAIFAAWAIGAALVVLYLGSTSAFNALSSALVVMSHITYSTISTHPFPLPLVANLVISNTNRIFLLCKRSSPFPTNFPLGSLGWGVNTITVVYMVFTAVMFCLPGFIPVGGANMN